jgi:hypothetical protein
MPASDHTRDAQGRGDDGGAQCQGDDALVSSGKDARSQSMLATLIIGQDAECARRIKAIGQNHRRALRRLRQGDAPVIVGYMDQPFDVMLQEGLDQRGHPVWPPVGIGDHQGHSALRNDLLYALQDEQVGQAGRAGGQLSWKVPQYGPFLHAGLPSGSAQQAHQALTSDKDPKL